mgnify:CR=1 FL=1
MDVKTIPIYLKKKGGTLAGYAVRFSVNDDVKMLAIPGATVECEGKILTAGINGLTPEIQKPAGSYTATVSHPDFETKTKTFTLP